MTRYAANFFHGQQQDILITIQMGFPYFLHMAYLVYARASFRERDQ